MKELRVRDDLRRLIPPLSEDERHQLEANLLSEGCRDPLVLWGDVILDGHNRFDICEKHGLPFETIPAGGVDDDESAREWMLRNQLGRRNLSPSAASDLRGMLYRQRKKPVGRPGQELHQSDAINGERTSAAVAKETGVSSGTIERDGAYSEALDKLEAIDPQIRGKLHKRDGALGKALGKRDATALSKKPPDIQRAILDRIESGCAKNYAAARQQVKRATFVQKAAKPVSRVGTIIRGDARTVLPTLGHEVACVVTDSPYGLETHRTREGGKDYADGKDYALDLLDATAAELVKRVRPDGHLYFFSGYSYAFDFKLVLCEHFDVQDNPLIWVKNRATMGDRSRRFVNRHEYVWFCTQKGEEPRPLLENADDVLVFDRQNDTEHSAEKPVELLQFLIECSTAQGELVLDPFAGSGATGVAAQRSGRTFVGIELDPKWAEVAEGRL